MRTDLACSVNEEFVKEFYFGDKIERGIRFCDWLNKATMSVYGGEMAPASQHVVANQLLLKVDLSNPITPYIHVPRRKSFFEKILERFSFGDLIAEEPPIFLEKAFRYDPGRNAVTLRYGFKFVAIARETGLAKWVRIIGPSLSVLQVPWSAFTCNSALVMGIDRIIFDDWNIDLPDIS